VPSHSLRGSSLLQIAEVSGCFSVKPALADTRARDRVEVPPLAAAWPWPWHGSYPLWERPVAMETAIVAQAEEPR
jgi:hypothetical protein